MASKEPSSPADTREEESGESTPESVADNSPPAASDASASASASTEEPATTADDASACGQQEAKSAATQPAASADEADKFPKHTLFLSNLKGLTAQVIAAYFMAFGKVVSFERIENNDSLGLLTIAVPPSKVGAILGYHHIAGMCVEASFDIDMTSGRVQRQYHGPPPHFHEGVACKYFAMGHCMYGPSCIYPHTVKHSLRQG